MNQLLDIEFMTDSDRGLHDALEAEFRPYGLHERR